MVLLLANEEGECRGGSGLTHFARRVEAPGRTHVPQLLGERLVSLDEAALATAKEVVTVGVHTVRARLAVEGLVQREQWLAQIQFVQHCLL